MGSIRRKRVLILSGAVILLCMIIIIGMATALFTDYKSVKNHLKAGNLEIGLKRTYLKYRVLDDLGRLAVTENNEVISFTESTSNTVFGMDATNMRIVPGSYFFAEMELSNEGNVAFTYNLEIKSVGEPTALTEQLQVTVINHEGKSTTKRLGEIINGVTIDVGEMTAKDKAQRFTVEISFIDDLEYNKNLATGEKPMNNNVAQTQSAIFDIVVTAVQATAPTTTH